MDTITIIDGDDLQYLLNLLNQSPYQVRIHQAADGNGIKVKINEGTWTWWLGRKDG